MKRTIIAFAFQLIGVTAIILSLKPRLDLFFYERGPHRYGYYDAYWNYFIIRSWLIALAGITVGLVLFWISSCIKPKVVTGQNVGTGPRFSVGRLAYVVCLVGGAILACAFLPELSGLHGRNGLSIHVPMETRQEQPTSQIFMIMSNDLTTPHVIYRPPDKQTN